MTARAAIMEATLDGPLRRFTFAILGDRMSDTQGNLLRAHFEVAVPAWPSDWFAHDRISRWTNSTFSEQETLICREVPENSILQHRFGVKSSL